MHSAIKFAPQSLKVNSVTQKYGYLHAFRRNCKSHFPVTMAARHIAYSDIPFLSRKKIHLAGKTHFRGEW
jgi:hypothetical protein